MRQGRLAQYTTTLYAWFLEAVFCLRWFLIYPDAFRVLPTSCSAKQTTAEPKQSALIPTEVVHHCPGSGCSLEYVTTVSSSSTHISRLT
ncbi:hypothetical protein F4774DRAFT_399147 [Daldinia eschscholtzii]|nr:hypothetical protein F4774DRAFT_399147 [Daldinia eschscholtzii]